MDTYPFLQVALGLLYLVVQVVWIAFFYRYIDPWLRQRIGERFGVTLQIGRRGLWTVAEKGQGGTWLLTGNAANNFLAGHHAPTYSLITGMMLSASQA